MVGWLLVRMFGKAQTFSTRQAQRHRAATLTREMDHGLIESTSSIGLYG
jgi:hypothetical protein